MVNKRFLDFAQRSMNQEVPTEKAKPKPQKVVPMARNVDFDYFFLDGDLGKEAHEAIIKKYGADHQFVTKNVFYDNDSKLIKGSKPGYILAVNEFLRGNGLRTATSYDVQRAIDEGNLNTKGFYEDLGLVLYSESGENEYFARDLTNQARQRKSIDFPVMFNLSDLELKVDQNAPQGLAFKLRDDSQIIMTPELLLANDRKKFSKVNQFGVQIFEDNGKYTFYSGNSVLRMLIRNRDSVLGARYWNLSGSDGGGRVIICREATNKNSGGRK